MIHQGLHRNPVALDRNQHRLLRLRREHAEPQRLSNLNSVFVAAAEFGDACREYPVVWIPAGNDAAGQRQVAPVAVFGLTPQENLYLQPDGWRTPYLPLLLRTYPFAMARAGGDSLVLCYDASWGGFSVTDGERLFDDAGAPSAWVTETRQQLENLEAEVERTRMVGEKLLQLQLLQEMRFDATLPDEQTLRVDGFLTIDEKRFAELPDAELIELHRNGLLGLIYAQRLSLGHMRRLVDWHVQRRRERPPQG